MTRVWRRLYDAVLRASAHPRASWWLAGLSFSESSFFPIPPDVMLAPMCLARPERAWRLAAITTLASVLGGVAGYFIGVFLLDAATVWMQTMGYWEGYVRVRDWFAEWGFLAVLVAGFSPIPYKVFTIAAGAGAMPLLPFVAASAIGRGGRFFLVAALVRWFGPALERRLLRYVDWIGWTMVLLIAVGVLWYQL